ncbi:hypothetical protein ABB37_07099 [Leptomonas pyrrhocoris]|uniref:NAD-dependent epimerase/dehydratase domain-containing protein n=1 Tax=Leptomonas pyrrhocoris TaxID=157538 RepID=A0A0M9FVX4_LEPPY|nr:hypothetical protein ABB37_07099 [Leptomonas pyrrhocoris]KPA77180.1 hypothetical protein ABB37_07099 [Leptomonas pyrrhocoris]|eukprot:XP_015655619.1 hypothetical protein ABB37_07099 [Leptomonas pyrrhocoris]
MHKKLLLFGGTGFVGSVVAQKALSRGYKVVIATRGGVPPLGSPMDEFAKRVRMIGGPAAAREALHLAQGGRLPSADSSPDSSSVSSSPSVSIPRSPDAQRPSADQLMRMVHQMEDETALEFVSIDASSRDQVFHLLHDHPDATAVINTVGLLTRHYEEARQVNGDVMSNIAAGVYHPKLVPAVRKVVYVSAEPYNLYSKRILGSKRMLKGYFHGKRIGEKAVLDNLGVKGVVLRPGMIYGTRQVFVTSATNPNAVTTLSIPLGWIGYPLDKLLTAVGGRKLLTPPVDVDVVAETAVRACEWANNAALAFHGICDVYRMHEICNTADPSLEDVVKPAAETVEAAEVPAK